MLSQPLKTKSSPAARQPNPSNPFELMNCLLAPTISLALAALLTSAGVAQAQVRVSGGPLLGLTMSSSRYTLGRGYANTSKARYRPGVEAGLVGAYEEGHIALQQAILFCQEGYNILNEYPGGTAGYTSSENNVRLDYLKFPFNIIYMPSTAGQGIRVFAGGYASFLLGGSQEVSGPVNAKLEVVASNEYLGPGQYYSRTVDAGLQAGVGYRTNALLIQASYSQGLRDTYVGSMNIGIFETSSYNRSLHFSVAYLFSSPK
jgi:hypothetical protein